MLDNRLVHEHDTVALAATTVAALRYAWRILADCGPDHALTHAAFTAYGETEAALAYATAVRVSARGGCGARWREESQDRIEAIVVALHAEGDRQRYRDRIASGIGMRGADQPTNDRVDSGEWWHRLADRVARVSLGVPTRFGDAG